MFAWISLLVSATTSFAQVPAKPFSAALQDALNGPEYRSTVSNIRSIEMDFASRELVLQPTLELRGKRFNEEREQMATLNRKPRYDLLGMTLAKPFSTGTRISVGPSWERALTPAYTSPEASTIDWNVTLTQSLWKDFFGRSTRLRREREEYERRQQLAEALREQSEMLVDFETLYWDWALALHSYDLQQKNVRRSREILRWVQDRFNRSAAESTDLLQARALLTQRELQVATLQFSLTQTGTRIERYVPNRQWQPDPKDLSVPRDPDHLVVAWKPEQLGEVSQLQYLEVLNEAGAETERAKEVRETIRPELDLELVYGKNAIDADTNSAVRESYERDHEYSSIGVVFRTGLDLGNERRKVDSARSSRDSAIQRRDALQAQNRVAWTQLKKEIEELRSRVQVAQNFVDLQMKKANAERERYRKGRSTAFQAITFEQDAAEAEITLWQLYALVRKTEARARLFAR